MYWNVWVFNHDSSNFSIKLISYRTTILKKLKYLHKNILSELDDYNEYNY